MSDEKQGDEAEGALGPDSSATEPDAPDSTDKPSTFAAIMIRGVLLILGAMIAAWFILATQDPRWFGDPH